MYIHEHDNGNKREASILQIGSALKERAKVWMYTHSPNGPGLSYSYQPKWKEISMPKLRLKGIWGQEEDEAIQGLSIHKHPPTVGITVSEICLECCVGGWREAPLLPKNHMERDVSRYTPGVVAEEDCRRHPSYHPDLPFALSLNSWKIAGPGRPGDIWWS